MLENRDLLPPTPLAVSPVSPLFSASLPALVERGGARAAKRFLEFFAARIRNPNTRMAYMRAAGRFLDWCLAHGTGSLAGIETIHVAAWVEQRGHEVSAPTVKQELAAVRKLLDWLVTGQIIPANPALSVRGPSHSVSVGKTPVISAEQARGLLRSIPETTIGGLRDRALIGLMMYTFARIGAALQVDVGDLYRENHRLRVRLREKGGRRHHMPCHHTLEEFLMAYMDAGGLSGDLSAPLFQTLDRRRRALTGRRLQRNEAWHMARRRSRAAGIDTPVCNHTFRAAGITAYLEHPDAKLEEAQKMAAHADPKTTRLYDRRNQAVSQDEVERIRI